MSLCPNCQSSFEPDLGWNSVVCPACASHPELARGTPEQKRGRTRKQRLIRLAVALGALIVVVGWWFWDSRRAEQRAIVASHQAVDRFHAWVNAEAYERVWQEASAFDDSSKKEDVLRLMAFVHQKLGNVQTSTRQSVVYESLTDAGPTATATYSTKFEKGQAEETFVFRQFATGEMKLVGYNIASSTFQLQ